MSDATRTLDVTEIEHNRVSLGQLIVNVLISLSSEIQN